MAVTYGNRDGITVTMEGPYGSVGGSVRLVQLDLPQSGWKGAVSPFSQIVQPEGISIRSKVDLLPDVHQLEQFRAQELAFTTENEDGVLTVYAIGEKPREDLVFQAVVTEVMA